MARILVALDSTAQVRLYQLAGYARTMQTPAVPPWTVGSGESCTSDGLSFPTPPQYKKRELFMRDTLILPANGLCPSAHSNKT